MYLVLCAETDFPALQAYEGLLRAGLAPVELVTAGDLARARTWEHRIGLSGTWVRIVLEDGRKLCSSSIHGVLNRLLWPPDDWVGQAVAADREYAAGELAAFYLSWLHALPRVVNRPTPAGLCGRWRPASEWAVLAVRAGFDTLPFSQMSSPNPETALTSVIVLHGEVFGAPVSPQIERACARLGQAASTDLLGVDLLDAGKDDLLFAQATPFPDLGIGGPGLTQALARALARNSA